MPCVTDVHPEQPERGSQHAAAEPAARVRPAAGADRHEDRWPPGGAGEAPRTATLMFIFLSFSWWLPVAMLSLINYMILCRVSHPTVLSVYNVERCGWRLYAVWCTECVVQLTEQIAPCGCTFYVLRSTFYVLCSTFYVVWCRLTLQADCVWCRVGCYWVCGVAVGCRL